MPEARRTSTPSTGRRRARDDARTPGSGPVGPRELDAFVDGYFAAYRSAVARMRGEPASPPAPDARRPVWELSEMIGGGAPDDLDAAWQITVALVERAPDEGALGFVAAGPVEDLVRTRHAELGDRILEEARRNPAFRRALPGIWGWEALPEPFRTELMTLAGVAPNQA
jgi:hypothetical protein